MEDSSQIPLKSAASSGFFFVNENPKEKKKKNTHAINKLEEIEESISFGCNGLIATTAKLNKSIDQMNPATDGRYVQQSKNQRIYTNLYDPKSHVDRKN